MVPVEIPRSIYNDLRRELEEPQVLLPTGPRQVGKTTLLRQLELDARQSGRRTRYLDLEEPGGSGHGGRRRRGDHRSPDAVDIVFVDEFDHLEDAGRIFEAIYDGPRGGPTNQSSGQRLLAGRDHGHLREILAGRTITYRVFPLSYEEYSAWRSPQRPSLEDYLRFGGLPGLAQAGCEERRQSASQHSGMSRPSFGKIASWPLRRYRSASTRA